MKFAIVGHFEPLWCETKGAVMPYVISQCRMCIGHMTFYYKRSTNAPVGGSCLLFICSSGLTLSPETHVCGWCLICVGHNMSSASPGWSLLPLTVIIVLALVNSVVSPAGTPKYLNETQECHPTPC